MNSIPNSTAPSSLYASYGFKTSEHQNESELFDVLFTSDLEKASDKEKLDVDAAMSQLEASAKTGNLSSIDMLTNLALRDDSLGKKAEQSLFEMFSAPSIGQATVADDISKAALTLHESYTRAPTDKKFVDAEAKLNAPSLLLYMAGATADDGLQKKLSQEIFSKDVQAQDSREQVGESNVWGKNRLISHDELACVARGANKDKEIERFNSPMSLMANEARPLAEAIAQILQQESGPGWPQFFPVNTGDHWVLLVIHQPKGSNKLEAFVFSSTQVLNETTKAALNDAANLAGADGICFLDQDLQQNVPNGCGLFVADAMKSLAAFPNHDPNHDPKDVIKTLQNSASNMSPIDCEVYNRNGRRQLYGSILMNGH